MNSNKKITLLFIILFIILIGIGFYILKLKPKNVSSTTITEENEPQEQKTESTSIEKSQENETSKTDTKTTSTKNSQQNETPKKDVKQNTQSLTNYNLESEQKNKITPAGSEKVFLPDEILLPPSNLEPKIQNKKTSFRSEQEIESDEQEKNLFEFNNDETMNQFQQLTGNINSMTPFLKSEQNIKKPLTPSNLEPKIQNKKTSFRSEQEIESDEQEKNLFEFNNDETMNQFQQLTGNINSTMNQFQQLTGNINSMTPFLKSEQNIKKPLTPSNLEPKIQNKKTSFRSEQEIESDEQEKKSFNTEKSEKNEFLKIKEGLNSKILEIKNKLIPLLFEKDQFEKNIKDEKGKNISEIWNQNLFPINEQIEKLQSEQKINEDMLLNCEKLLKNYK
ncbi:MAG: hypothetical protein ACN23H_01235 [Candidatus Phytoplasma vitis]|nr:MAG: hypothetical protein M6G77_01235 [Candidatus Phytoplasma vitis]